jgi:hypothetical protein
LSFRLFGESLRKKFTLRNRIKAVPKLLAWHFWFLVAKKKKKKN